MVDELSRQGVDTVISTSHYYATHRSPREFLDRRARAFEQLKERLPEDAPRILLIQAAWILILTGTGMLFWHRNQKRIVIQGG